MELSDTQLPKEKLATFYNATKRMRAAQGKPVLGNCMFWTGNCASPPINSHLLARSWLARISDATQHVIQFGIDTAQLGERSAQIAVRRIGIHQTTTFPGFCETHDSEVFSCLEMKDFDGSNRQLLALRYRSICRETCAKHQMIGCHIPGAFRSDMPTPFDTRLAAEMKRCIHMLAHKGELETAFQENKHILESYAVQFEKTPTVLASATFYPLLTFTGRRLDYREQWTTLTILPRTTGGGWAIFNWLKTAPKNSALLVKSFRKVPPHQQSQALINFIFEFTENHAISPYWWHSLSQSQQRTAMNRFGRVFAKGFIDNPPPEDALVVKEKPWIDWKPVNAKYIS